MRTVPTFRTIRALTASLFLMSTCGSATLYAAEEKPKATAEQSAEPKPTATAVMADWKLYPNKNGTLYLCIQKDGFDSAQFSDSTVEGLKPTYDMLHWHWVPTNSEGDHVGPSFPIISGDFYFPGLKDPDSLNLGGLGDYDPFEAVTYPKAELIDFIIRDYLEIDLDFSGGSFQEWQTALSTSINTAYKQQLPDLLKSVLPSELKFKEAQLAQSPRVAPMTIHGSTMGAQPWYSEEIVYVDKLPDQSLRSPRWILEKKISYSRESNNQFTIMPKLHEHYESLFLNLFNRTSEADDLAALFEIGWQLDSQFVLTKIRFHPETGIMILSGPSHEIETARYMFDTWRVNKIAASSDKSNNE